MLKLRFRLHRTIKKVIKLKRIIYKNLNSIDVVGIIKN